ncbi:bifunctional adenosylcobinamide kinase/adenosylcobinamide-phosphate guanylyltransferase [Deltaproteobacteria bacterium Smac51]|nr:bifunctional adenosylcobinamide kinase/adenosylcobinamide-phosphate guanylyltransferase [Deltaproteobacteria bacterium Smac51]
MELIMAGITLYLGGAKSGKTRLALAAAEALPAPRLYLATAQAFDDEMTVRIKNHQAERGPDWRTIEAPLEPDKAISVLTGNSVVLLDCITLWLNNLLAENDDPDWIMTRVAELAASALAYAGPVIIVSNEVGGGIVPMNALARKFRDLAGAANQLLAARAEKVVLAVAGLELVVADRTR